MKHPILAAGGMPSAPRLLLAAIVVLAGAGVALAAPKLANQTIMTYSPGHGTQRQRGRAHLRQLTAGGVGDLRGELGADAFPGGRHGTRMA